jgi:hypothetical protein
MEHRATWLTVAVWLATCTAFLLWFDYAALSAIVHPTVDSAGNLRFQVPGYTNTVYPFTYVGVATSVVGVAAFVFRQERTAIGRGAAAALGLVVGNLASIGMLDVYEQVFIGLGYFTAHGRADSIFWLNAYWGTPGDAGFTLGGLLVVATVLPWSRRSNLPGVTMLAALSAGFLALWFVHGFWGPPNGDAFDYWMNGLSRGSTQLILVAAVADRDVFGSIVSGLGNLRRRLTRRWARRPSPVDALDGPTAGVRGE